MPYWIHPKYPSILLLLVAVVSFLLFVVIVVVVVVLIAVGFRWRGNIVQVFAMDFSILVEAVVYNRHSFARTQGPYHPPLLNTLPKLT